MDESLKPDAAFVPNRAWLIAIAALANGVGLAPYLLFVDRLGYLFIVVPGSAVVAYLALRKQPAAATAHLSFAEWVFAAWSAVAKPSTVALTGLLFFFWGYAAQKLYAGAAGYFGYPSGGDPQVWGFRGSIWFVFFGVFYGPVENARALSRQLFPHESWARSAFSPLLARSRLRAVTTVAATAVAALAAMLWFLDPGGGVLPALLVLLLFYTSYPLAELGEEASNSSEAKVVDATAALLEEADYRVVRAPRTGKPEIDPLLQSVDLLARSDGRAFAVQVKAIAPNVPVEWTEANAVRTAATLLSDEIVAGTGAPVPVEPMLMLVGGKISPGLEAFSQREGVPIVHFDDVAGAIRDRSELTLRLQAAGMVFPATQPSART